MKHLPDGQYNFKETEKKILDFWHSKPFFSSEYDSLTDKVQSKEDFKKDHRKKWTLICPPPNAYDRPHIGNLSGYSYMDAMARYHRMKGDRVIMIPGKDHAGLEGESTFIRDVLEKEGKKKSDYSREEFYKRVWDHQQKCIELIKHDEKGVGLSADFEKDIYTLDPRIVNTILETFTDMYKKGLIYKGVRIVNWDIKAGSTIPDNQCVREERDGKLYYVKYPVVNSKLKVKSDSSTPSTGSGTEQTFGAGSPSTVTVDSVPDEIPGQVRLPAGETGDDNTYSIDEIDYITVATTRPETMLGDTALVVHPDDTRYKHLIGKKVLIPLANREIPIISSGRIEKEFGTGVLKLTPAHAPEDWEIMQEWNSKIVTPHSLRGLSGENNNDGSSPSARSLRSVQAGSGTEPTAGTGTPTKGTGITEKDLKIGGHDNPELIGNEHEKIDYINVIGKDLRMCGPIPAKYKGLKVNAAREEIIKDLNENGFIEKEESIKQNVQVSERTGVVVEPLMASQWFMDVSGFKKPLREMVEKGDVRIHPKNLEKRFFAWVDNMRDWAITRNLWWGYRVPVWYAGEVTEEISEEGKIKLRIASRASHPALVAGSHEMLKQVQHDKKLEDFQPNNPDHMRVQLESPGEGWIQDEDILDTWFSSGQWPYSVLGVHDLMDVAYPTDVLVSATDLLVKWDLTMMLFSYYKTGKAPFNDLFLTGLVKGTDGQKMSKSKKNFVPIDDVKEQYGTDSFRMNCFYQNKAGRNYLMTPETLKTFRNFNNKIWNASKFVMGNLEGFEESGVYQDLFEINSAEEFKVKSEKLKLEEDDKKMLEHLIKLESDWNKDFEKFRFGKVTEDLYASFWHEFCDIYIEKTKSRVWKDKETGEYKSTPESRLTAQSILYYSLKSYLKMLHPFIPFITEEIWQHLVGNGEYVRPMMLGK